MFPTFHFSNVYRFPCFQFSIVFLFVFALCSFFSLFSVPHPHFYFFPSLAVFLPVPTVFNFSMFSMFITCLLSYLSFLFPIFLHLFTFSLFQFLLCFLFVLQCFHMFLFHIFHFPRSHFPFFPLRLPLFTFILSLLFYSSFPLFYVPSF